jgi:hypothetical protein
MWERFIKGTIMAKKLSKLDSIRIPQPCSTEWEQMIGDDRTRFCNECNKHVYNLSAMTRRQAEAIIEASRGKLCARVIRQEDGTTVVRDDAILPDAGLHHIRRASPIASAVVSAMMAVSPVMAAQTSVPAKQSASVLSQQGQKKPGAQPQETTSKLSGSVLDVNGAVMANAIVTLVNQDTGDIRGTISKDDGAFEFNMLKPGSYSLQVEASGFAPAQTGVNLQQNQQQRVDVPMQALRYESVGGLVAIREQPLRTLYKESDLIVVATAGNSVRVQSERESNLMKTALNVFSTLKGKAKKSVVYVYHWAYKELDDSFAKDKKQLVFLRHSDRGKDGYEVDDLNYGVKKLSDADLTIYTQRIAELAKIMQTAKPDDAQIVEWLVRCVEEKATRQEGLMELSQSFNQLRYDEEAKNEQEVEEDESEALKAEEVEADSKAEMDEQADESEDVEEEEEYLKITSHMTQAQKDRVLAVLYRTEEVTDKEDNLIELAKDWKDARLAPFLLEQLHRQKDAPKHFAESIIEYLVDLLNNSDVEQAAKEYSDNVSYEDEEEDTEVGAEKAETAESKQPEILQVIQQRSERLKAFLLVIESKIKK